MRCTILKPVILFLLLVGCTSDEIPDNRTLVFAIESAPSTLDPRMATDANSQRLTQLIFNSLVRVGEDLNITSEAAESWTYKDKTYIFQLRKGLTFSNGRPLAREDILFSFESYLSSKSPFQTVFKSIEKVEVSESEPFQIKLFLSHYNALLLTDLMLLKLLPKNEILSHEQGFTKNPIGTGSFVLEEQQPNLIKLKARKDHPFAQPKIEVAEFKIIRDDNTRYLKLIKGAVDIVQTAMPPSKVRALEKNKSLNVFTYPGPSMNYLILNLKDSHLRELRTRQTLAQALNREEIVTYKLEGLGQVANSIIAPGNPYYHPDIKAPEFDLEKAKSFVQSKKLYNYPLTLKVSNTPQTVEVAKVIAHQLTAAGFNIKLQSYEWGTFFGDVRNGNFQIAMMRWIGTIDPDIYRLAFHSQEHPPGRNRGYYSNPLLDVLLDKGISIEDVKARIEHYKKIQKIVLEDLPIIPLWYNTQDAIVNKRVKGYRASQTSDFLNALHVYKD